MKKFRLFALTSLLLLLPLAGCKALDFSANVNKRDNVESVTLDIKDMTLEIGESFQLTPEITYRDGKETDVYKRWMSSDTKVVTVTDNGFVSAVGGGKATVTFLAGVKASAACSVKVNFPDDGGGDTPEPPQPGEFTIRLNTTSKQLSLRQTFQLVATTSEDAEVTWAVTRGEGIVEVDQTGLVTVVWLVRQWLPLLQTANPHHVHSPLLMKVKKRMMTRLLSSSSSLITTMLTKPILQVNVYSHTSCGTQIVQSDKVD